MVQSLVDNLGLFFPSFGQGVSLGIVKERMIAITPGEAVGADAQIGVWNKFGAMIVMVVLHLKEICVDRGQNDSGTGHVEEHLLPEIGIWLMTRVSITGRARHKATHGVAAQHGLETSQFG